MALLMSLSCTGESLPAPKLAALRSHNVRGIRAKVCGNRNDAK